MPQVQFPQHKILLLQQLQPHPAQILLQELQKILDQGRNPQKRSRRRRLPEKQKIVFFLLPCFRLFQKTSTAAGPAPGFLPRFFQLPSSERSLPPRKR
ncbi:hypothetical protein KSP39_PZI018490 [Platanthera zijinensis]|uniref:Uncharacterized protein n=1 Tax=Platanthera zijinensis TaxID=2320716 RepID=A0AAP0B4F6_9ASPA